MARHNILIQRHVGGTDGSECNTIGPSADWRDCGTVDAVAQADSYGNTGFGHNIKEARRKLAWLRKRYPHNAYRLIQIID